VGRWAGCGSPEGSPTGWGDGSQIKGVYESLRFLRKAGSGSLATHQQGGGRVKLAKEDNCKPANKYDNYYSKTYYYSILL
jgi:hypothetical protein